MHGIHRMHEPSRTTISKHRPRARQLMLRLGAMLCLLAWFASAGGVAPGLAAALGRIDPQHRVAAEIGDDGVRIVLHHAAGCRHHRHQLAARVLTLLAEPQADGDRDHVLHFGGASAQELRNGTAGAPALDDDGTMAPLPVLDAALPMEPRRCEAAVASAPPDLPPAAATIARSTTRLI